MPANMPVATRDPELTARRNRELLEKSRVSKFQKVKLALKLRNLVKDKNMIEKLKSRKFLAALVGGIIVSAGSYLGISEAVTQQLVVIVVGYIIGQGAVDTAAELKMKK